MTKFDSILLHNGYIKPYEDVHLWYKEKTVWFLINPLTEILQSEQHNLESVGGELERGVVTKVKDAEMLDWVLPMLAADYYHHRNHIFSDEELKYSKMAMVANKNLTEKTFSNYLRQYL